MESYSTCNPDEVEYAFRAYGTTTKDWGKYINLSLIDSVMIPYLSKRRELSVLEEQKILPEIQKPKESTSDEAMEDWAKEVSLKIKNKVVTIDFMPIMLYEWIEKNGKVALSKEDKWEYLNRAIQHRKGNLIKAYSDFDTQQNKNSLNLFMGMVEDGCVTGDEVENVKKLAKKIILYEYLSKDANNPTSSEATG